MHQHRVSIREITMNPFTSTSRDRQMATEACDRGIARCNPACPHSGTDEMRASGAAWSNILDAARRERAAEADRQRTVRFGTNLAVRAADYGIVPHMERVNCPGCAHKVRVNRNAASVLQYRAEHALPGSIYGETVWAAAARCTSRK